jgi:hypothetical protein
MFNSYPEDTTEYWHCLKVDYLILQGEQKVRERYSHYSSVYIVRPIALKPIPLDFSGHLLSSNVIESGKYIPQKVIVAYKRKVVGNDL